jgi:hypothetical protein
VNLNLLASIGCTAIAIDGQAGVGVVALIRAAFFIWRQLNSLRKSLEQIGNNEKRLGKEKQAGIVR